MSSGKVKPAQQRASIQRSRAGCSTCKRRRVKCDEAHPRCLRCIRANLDCEGYPKAATSTSTTTVIKKRPEPLLLPKASRYATLAFARPTLILPGETEVENRYLRYFQEQTTSGFQSAFDWTLWNRTVLQGCHHEPFVRDAVVAIGALHKSLRSFYPIRQETRPGTLDPMMELHREYAYRTYGKALRKMQSAIDAGLGLRLALVACLLVVCFESHLGDRYKAVTHAHHGLQLLEQPDNSFVDVDDEITDAFKNLDIQITTVSDGRSLETHQMLLDADSALVESMPLCFKTIEEAKSYWHIVMRRCCHFIATTWGRTQPWMLAREFKTRIPGGVLTTVGNNVLTASYQVDDFVRAGHGQFHEEMTRWLAAFEPILHKARRTDKTTLREFVVATMLQIQALTAKINLAGIISTQETSYDQFLSDFRNIIRFAEDIVTVRQSRPQSDDFWTGSFLLDLGLVEPLFIVLLRCRDPVLRRQAIAILKSWHVECWWDPLLIVAIGQFIMDIEEQGMVNGFIPESSRATMTAKSHCPPDRVLLVQCVQRTGGPEGGIKWIEGFVRW